MVLGVWKKRKECYKKGKEAVKAQAIFVRFALLFFIAPLLFIAGCGDDKPSFYVGEQKVEYAIPQGFALLEAKEHKEYLSMVREMFASDGLTMGPFLIESKNPSGNAEQNQPALDYVIVASLKELAFIDTSPAEFYEIVSETVAGDEGTTGKALQRAVGKSAKPKLMGRTSDKATLFHAADTPFDASLETTLGEGNQKIMVLVTAVHLRNKVVLLYHYRPMARESDRANFYQRHQKLLQDMDFRITQ